MAIYERMTLKPRAGRLPEYSRQTENYVPGQGVSARVDDSAARIAGAGREAEARALGHLGGVVQNVAGNLMAAYDDYSKSKAVELITKYRRIMNDNLYGEGGILTQQGEDAFNADGQREAKARQLRGELMKDAGERTKHYFTLQADEYDADSSLRAQKYARDERLKWMDRNNDAAAEERANAALLAYDDPESFNKAVAETLWNVRQKLARQGYSEEAIQHRLKETSSKLFRAAVQQALSNGDIWEAERILGHGNGAASKPGTTSANNLAAFNYGNVRIKSGGFAAYASRNDGLMAIGDRVLRYNNAPDRGWHAQTLREFTEIYAPIPKELKDAQKTIEFFQAVQKDGGKLTAEQEKAYEDAIKTIAEAKKKDPEAMNNPANYAAFLGKRLGLDPDARINFRDPEILAGLIQSIPIMEHGRGVNIGREEAVRAAQALLSGQKPRMTGEAKAASENATQGPQGGTDNVPEGDGLHMTAPDMAWAREAIERKREAMAVEAEFNRGKAVRELLKGKDDAVKKAEYFGDTAELEDVAKQLRELGEVEKADELSTLARDCVETRDARRFAAEQALPDVAKRLQETRTAMEAAEKAKDTAEYEKQAKILEATNKIYEARAKAYLKDPAAAAAQEIRFQLPDNATWEDKARLSMEIQQKNGVEDPQPLSLAEVDKIAGEYLKSENRVAFLASLQEGFGEQAEAVMKQLIGSKKLPGDANLMMVMDASAAEALAKADVPGAVKEMETALSVDNIVKETINATIREELEELLPTFYAQGNSTMAAQVLDASYKLSLKYMERGMGAEEAAEKAALEVLGNRYNVRGTFRVPANFDADAVQTGAVNFLNRLDAETLKNIPMLSEQGMTEKDAERQKKSILQNSGRWISNADESGLVLALPVAGGYMPVSVLDKDGKAKPLELSFEDLTELSKQPHGYTAFGRFARSIGGK